MALKPHLKYRKREMQYRDNLSESGAFYIVPNKHGPGKTIVRRPHPPPTSAPLDDDFDAFTQAPTTARGRETVWDDQHYKPTPTASQLVDDDFDAITYTETRGQGTTADSDWNARDDRPLSRIRTRKNPIRYRYAPDQEASPSECGDYGDYSKCMNDMVQAADGGVDFERRARPGELAVDGEMRTTSSTVERRYFDIPQAGNERQRLSPIIRRDLNDHAPGRGQNYEIVNRRVLEDGPERTVTISTWRQEVARSVSPETPMSVYYVNAKDYAEGNAEEEMEGQNDLDNHAPHTRKRNLDDKNRQGGSGTSPKSNEKRKGKEKRWPSVDQRTSPSRPRAFSESSFSPRSERITFPSNLVTTQSGSPEGKGPSRTVRPQRANTYSKPQALPRGSTPSRERQTLMSLGSDDPPRSSTPVKALPHLPSFHPTESGSTISSIKTTSLTSFENILSSCQPSLLHTTPVLAKLGIKSEEHLRAVGRLSEETRDREVREEALRMGLTVVEWAILLDKLQSL